MSIIKVENVKKYFKNTKALDGISFEVKEGEVVGLLGPNGAGKTTIVRILTTLLEPDAGTVIVDGVDVAKHPDQVRRRIGLAGQYAAVDQTLTGRQNLHMVGRLYHLSRTQTKKQAEKVLKQMGLEDAADRSVKTYSGGMRRRLDLGASLMFTPRVLFLDEPTTGLDPKTRRDLWQLIRNLVKSGVTLLLTTQYLEEADELADRIVLIDHGKTIARGTSDELKKQISSDVVLVELKTTRELSQAADILSKAFKTQAEINEPLQQLRVPVTRGVSDLKKVIDLLHERKIRIAHISLAQPTLDDVFLELTDGGGSDE